MNTLAQAKRDFEIGYLTNYELRRWPILGKGWFIWLGKGNAAGWLVDARTKQPRDFKTVDSAVNTLEAIGFKVEQLYQG
jgi:hypothetical protein